MSMRPLQMGQPFPNSATVFGTRLTEDDALITAQSQPSRVLI